MQTLSQRYTFNLTLEERFMNIEEIAQACHEINRAFCIQIGDSSQVSWDKAPRWQYESAITGVNKIAEHVVNRPSDSHDFWLAEKLEDGWKYGEVKDVDAKTHPCFVSYEELSELQKHKDTLFFTTALALLTYYGLMAPEEKVEEKNETK